ncbi:MAG: glucose-6-phosphate isomerase [Solirubrobacterales bacterium]|nr:glucose-6-phosphate isomerase [Solirubrobacterales bacterium]
MTVPLPGEIDAWDELTRHAVELAETDLRALFAADPERPEALSVDGAGVHLDFSKQLVTEGTVGLLEGLAVERRVSELRDAMFRGERINTTENRPVLHVALRMPPERSLVVDGKDVVREVHAVLDRMAGFCDRVRLGEWAGQTGRPIRTVVNIGIGGSALGPEMAYAALREYAIDRLDFRFVSNVDGADLGSALEGLDPAETLFVVCSKTFTTLETMTNAAHAREWLLSGLGDDGAAVARHFVAVSTNTAEVTKFGIDPDNMFVFWDWVGGRYSMDSAIGLTTMLAVGPDRFHDMLAGFHEVDELFVAKPFRSNLPMLHGMLAVWNRDFLGFPSTAVIPYSHRLARFPAYLQQLTMESNGKRVTREGEPVGVETGAVYWGEPGTNAQHSFFQLFHQGTQPVPADLIAFRQPDRQSVGGQEMLVANALAQGRALAFGRTADEAREAGIPEWQIPHRTFPGNRPTSTLLLDRLTPRSLGSLVALYEHSVFVQGAIWGIDSFDQWGVELGKEMALEIVPALTDGDGLEGLDPSTRDLALRFRDRS